MRFRFIATLAVACGVMGATLAHAQSIGLYFDSGGTTCGATIAPFAPFNLYLIANLGGAASGGLQGYECCVTGADPAWFVTFTPLPGICDPGACPNPMDPAGASIGFPGCQTSLTGRVLLTTWQVITLGASATRYLAVERSPASMPAFDCPTMSLCDAPVFTRVCVAGGQAILNGPPCTVAVEQQSWSRVKGLYD